MKNTLILKDGSEITIEPGSSLSDMRILSGTKMDMLTAWDRLNRDNLSEIQIKDADGLTIAAYQDIVFDSETSVENKDGTILTSFKLREKTEMERLKEEVDILKEGQEILEGVAFDTGEAISRLAEEGGLI